MEDNFHVTNRQTQGFVTNGHYFDCATTPTDLLDGLLSPLEYGLEYPDYPDYRGGGNDMPIASTQSYMANEGENEFASFSPTHELGLVPQQPLSQLQCGLQEAEKQFQEDLECDPFLRMAMVGGQTQKVKLDPSGCQSIQTQPHESGDFRGTATGPIGCKESKHGEEDILSTFPNQPLDSAIFQTPEPGSLRTFPENQDIKGFHTNSLFASGGRALGAVKRLETDSSVRCFSAPGRFDSMSKPEPYVVPPRPASVDSNLSASAMVVDDHTTTKFPFNVAARLDPSSDTTHTPFRSNTSYTREQNEVQSACVAVMENQRETVHQQPQMVPYTEPRYGLSPSLKVMNQPQQEQTVLYESDSANRGVLKDREGKGFPAVMVVDYEGPAEIFVYAATSTGEAHPFFFVQCVTGVGHCHPDVDHDGLRFVRTTVNPGNGMRAIFPKLSVKRYKEKEVKHNFAQWQHEKSFVFLRFLAQLPNGTTLDAMTDKVHMTRKADMQKRRDQLKGQTNTESNTSSVQPHVSQPVIARIIGSPALHEGGTEICIYGSNFAPDCCIIFSFQGQPVEAHKSTDQMACTNTHLLVRVPPSPLSRYNPRFGQQCVAKVYVINPTTCSQSADSMNNVFVYSD